MFLSFLGTLYANLLRIVIERNYKMIEELMKRLALEEFGTLEGVGYQYVIDHATGYVQYCVWRK